MFSLSICVVDPSTRLRGRDLGRVVGPELSVDDVEKAAKFDHFDVVMDVRVELRLNDDILDVLEDAGDKASAALMAEGAKKAGKALVAAILHRLGEAESECAKSPASAVDKVLQAAKKDIQEIIAAEQKNISAIPGEVWAEFVKRKKQYKDYKLKAATDVTIQVLMVTSDAIATGAAAAGTFGAAGVVGVVILARDCAKLARQVYDLALSAEKVQKDLAKDIKTLEDAYRSTVRRVGQEVTGTLFKAALSTDSPFLATLPKCNEKIKLLDNKVAGLETAGREFSSLLTEALDKSAKLENQMDGLSDKKARKAYEKLVATRKELDQALKDCTKMMKRVRDTKPGIKGLQVALDALNESNPRYLKIFDVALPAVTGVALAGPSGGLGFAGAATGLDHANTAVTLAAVMGNEAKGFLESL